MNITYPVVVHKEPRSDYGVTVPDLPGCFSAGSTFDEALAMAREPIELHIEGLIEEGQAVPKPRPIEDRAAGAAYRDGMWALVTIDGLVLRGHAKRVNLTIPERVLDALDRAASVEHDSRSGLLTKAATAYLQQRKESVEKTKRAVRKWRASR